MKLPPKNGKGKVLLFCGNGHRDIPFTELNIVSCSVTGFSIFIDIQRGKYRMKKSK